MDWYARFYYDVPCKDLNKIMFIADSKYSKKYRYAIIDEDKDHYYIALELNNINCKDACQIPKSQEGYMFYVSQE